MVEFRATPESTTRLAEASPGNAGTPAILYSFRRCPYAIRARLALAAAGLRPGVDLELREVALKAKPPELLAISAKGTVPVLALPAAVRGRSEGSGSDPGGERQAETLTAGQAQGRGAEGGVCSAAGPVLEESLAIMSWALQQADPVGWTQGWTRADQQRIAVLIAENDGPFKHHLDRFKYAGRFGPDGLAHRLQHRQLALAILQDWNRQLQPGGWLLGSRPSLADVALLPFVRQFRLADPQGFDGEAELEALQSWLQRFLDSMQLAAVMEAPWAQRSAWRSPRWLYHLALREEWQAARAAGIYARSTRGRSLQEVGFVHLSCSHQVDATARRFYADVPRSELLLLSLDPQRLRKAGLDVRLEPAPGSGELFPHLYGSLPLEAVLLAEPWQEAPGHQSPAEPQPPEALPQQPKPWPSPSGARPASPAEMPPEHGRSGRAQSQPPAGSTAR